MLPPPRSNSRPLADRQAAHRAGEPQPRLRVPVDDVHANAELAPDPFHERAAVAGVADGGGRDGDDLFRAGAGRNGVEVAHRVERPRHRLRAQPPALVHVVDEPERRARSRQQSQVARAVELEDDDTAGVGADVDDRHGKWAAGRAA